MKYHTPFLFLLFQNVAPLVGAWIEINCASVGSAYLPSLPSWERGLKYSNFVLPFVESCVAPLVGAWIEMLGSVAIYAGLVSLPSWERGLKSYEDNEELQQISRSPRGSVD